MNNITISVNDFIIVLCRIALNSVFPDQFQELRCDYIFYHTLNLYGVDQLLTVDFKDICFPNILT